MTLMILVSATWIGLVPRQADHPSGAAARRRRPRDRRRPSRSPHRAGDARRVRVARRGVQHDGRRAGRQPAEARTLARSTSSARTCELDERRRYIETVLERIATGVVSLGPEGRIETINSAALRLLDVDARCRVGRRRRCSRATISQPLEPLHAPGAAAARRRPAAQEIALVREGRELHLPPPRRRCSATTGSSEGAVLGVRRRDAAHPDAAGRRVARRGPAAGARDQESADADPAVRGADAASVPHRAARRARAGRRVHLDDHRRGRVAEGAGRRVRAVRAHAGAARRCRPISTRCSPRRWRSTTDCSSDIRLERRFTRRPAAGAGRRRAAPAGRHQPGGQRRRGTRRRRGAVRARTATRRRS